MQPQCLNAASPGQLTVHKAACGEEYNDRFKALCIFTGSDSSSVTINSDPMHSGQV